LRKELKDNLQKKQKLKEIGNPKNRFFNIRISTNSKARVNQSTIKGSNPTNNTPKKISFAILLNSELTPKL